MFTKADFDLFNDPTLAGRMTQIRTVIDPKFEAVTPQILPVLQAGGQTFYPHIAKHLRRFKNPPVDTWVAFSEDPRRYKALPHFELGLWPDRLFCYLDLLDESKVRVQASLTPAELQKLYRHLPADYLISHDHTVAEMRVATSANIDGVLNKFAQYKHSELVAGRAISLDSPLLADEAGQLAYIQATFTTLLPIYLAIMAKLRLKTD
ncbi:DUF1054 family protein [Lactiplantibacillus sp. WILCCON 0030]|uniref:UPF0637 protein RA086_09240 n=1 Tax=Lactiplantibacillus brownii TaxID=3069269 RepID=A0ABU1ABJ3_9LACO|nr:DUF1054 family protein [Lactiplantibacillus brownii]MDQ7937792.1 DUF1054 family protein [Lactiplantibacillus brownii]